MTTVDPMIVAAAVVLVISAFAGGVVSVIGAVGKMRHEQDAVLAKVTDVANKTEEVHALVNGSAHTAAAKLAALEAQIISLHARIATLQDQRVTDAQDAKPPGKA